MDAWIIVIIIIGIVTLAITLFFVIRTIKRNGFDYPVGSRAFDKQIQIIISKLEAIEKIDATNFENVRKSVNDQKTDISNVIKDLNDSIKNLNDNNTKQMSRIDTVVIDSKTKLDNLSSIFTNSKNRGNVGEFTLEWILSNILGEESEHSIWQREYKYENKPGLRIDAVIHTGINNKKLAIDSKFPMIDAEVLLTKDPNDFEYKQKEKNFRTSLISKISEVEKYIDKKEGVDNVIMYIPSQVVFELILTKFEDIYQKALNKKIFLTSPTTLPIVLHSQQMAIRDYKISKDIHKVKDLVEGVLIDFQKWDERNQKLKKAFNDYVQKTNSTFEDLEKSTNKINSKIEKIQSIDTTNQNSVKKESDDDSIGIHWK
ncbi:DNA recombination protein RmuC [Mycoplasma yeatsii]|uniref:DNA recombination protein RmuC n=1 Tax=Mycoplasma yeatsii TaxID=51365 RepID=UPI0005B24BFE|nr:DNA recombination protein RmuC [Mycoplasma yeatsii]AJM72220.1 RmuC family protein [Mycoplasma yeatsii GM274B]